MESGDNNTILHFMASTVEQLSDRVNKMSEEITTKGDLERLETVIHGEFERVDFQLDNIEKAVSLRLGRLNLTSHAYEAPFTYLQETGRRSCAYWVPVNDRFWR